jgi:hypothetical protein
VQWHLTVEYNSPAFHDQWIQFRKGISKGMLGMDQALQLQQGLILLFINGFHSRVDSMGEVCKVAKELSDSGKLSTSFLEMTGSSR